MRIEIGPIGPRKYIKGKVVAKKFTISSYAFFLQDRNYNNVSKYLKKAIIFQQELSQKERSYKKYCGDTVIKIHTVFQIDFIQYNIFKDIVNYLKIPNKAATIFRNIILFTYIHVQQQQLGFSIMCINNMIIINCDKIQGILI